MNRLLSVALVAAIGLSACSKKPETAPSAAAPAAPTAPAAPAGHPAMPQSMPAATPNTGKVLQVIQAGTYTYVEAETQGGEKVWIAGGPLQVKAGDSIQWGDYAVMENFNSKTLNRTFDRVLFVQTWGPVGGSTAQMAPHGNMAAPSAASATSAPAAKGAAPAAGTSQGVVKSVANAGGYTYLEVKQDAGTVWVAVPENASVKAGDKVSWDSGMVMRDFNAKSLGRTFDQIVFAGGVTVAK